MNTYLATDPADTMLDQRSFLPEPGMDISQEWECVTAAKPCAYYQQVCHLPAVLDSISGQIVVVAGRVQAVMVPWTLGQRVRAALTRSDTGGGPIVSHLRSGTWTFLTNSDRDLEPTPDDTRLWLGNVVVLSAGAPIALPTPTATNTDRCREWELPPTSPQRPTTFAVLTAIRACLERGGRR